ncbi:hypothetical protein M405DRAFT_82431 [Rhizopogon salebrosus TDB-379]|nr:hypothetical protein M405DRAFT_82431 [Rhizopogon salebrosus TDB-379]
MFSEPYYPLSSSSMMMMPAWWIMFIADTKGVALNCLNWFSKRRLALVRKDIHRDGLTRHTLPIFYPVQASKTIELVIDIPPRNQDTTVPSCAGVPEPASPGALGHK